MLSQINLIKNRNNKKMKNQKDSGKKKKEKNILCFMFLHTLLLKTDFINC